MHNDTMTADSMEAVSLLQDQLNKTNQQLEEMFTEAFGVSIGDGFPEVEDDYEKRFGVRPNGNLMVLFGVQDREMLADNSDDPPNISPEARVMAEACAAATAAFLRKLTPSSVYNEAILEDIAAAVFNLSAAQGQIECNQLPEALHFVMEAKFYLGASHGLLQRREAGRQIASKGGRKRDDNFRPHREAAFKYIAEYIPPSMSAQEGASRMLKADVFPFSHGKLAELIREYRAAAQQPEQP